MPKLPTPPADRLLPALRRVVLVRESADRTDGQLLTAFLRDRDGDAFAVLVRRHGPMVLGVARRVIGDHHTADDAFQAVFLVLARRANAVRPREQVGNWLYGVAYRTAIKARMVLARRRSREKQVDAMPETVQLPPDSWSDLQPVIDAELALLPNKLRVPVVLCDLEGRPQRSVAKQLGIAPATLAARVAAARRLLAERLGKRGISLSGGALAVVLGERAAAAHVPAMLADSAVRAAEAVATGNAASGFVSAHALQLSDGVLRMMMLAKLKTACVAVVVAVLAAGGFGVSQAGAEEPKAAPAAALTVEVAGKPAPHPDDAFLRRTLLDLTGAAPTPLEYLLFRTDADKNKKAKVIDWLIADARVQAGVAKRMGIEAARVELSRANGLGVTMKVLPEAATKSRVRLTTVNEHLNTFGLWGTNQTTPYLTQVGEGLRLNLNTTGNPGVTNLAIVQEPVSEIVYGVFDAEAARTEEIEFLKQAVKDARGTAPTPLEERYFTEDQDPKKREKLLDTLLKDGATAKKLGEAWRKKLLEPKPPVLRWAARVQPAPEMASTFRFYLGVHQPDPNEALVDSLIAAKKTDEQILEAVTLANAKRLPTAEEKKATLAVLGTLMDKKAAWVAIARTLAK